MFKYNELIKLQKDYERGIKISVNIDYVDEMIQQANLENEEG